MEQLQDSRSLNPPKFGRLAFAVTLLVGGFVTFLGAGAIAFVAVLQRRDDIPDWSGTVGIASAMGIVSLGLHLMGKRLWLSVDLSPAALTGAPTDIDRVRITSSGRTMAASWLVMLVGVLVFPLGLLACLVAFTGLAQPDWWIQFTGAAPLGLLLMLVGGLLVRAGLGGLRDPCDRDLQILAGAVGGVASGILFFTVPWPELRVLRFGLAFGGVVAYALTLAFLRRREDYATRYPVAVGRVAIWFVVLPGTHLIALGMYLLGVHYVLVDPIAVIPGVVLYVLLVRFLGEEKSLVGGARELLLVAGCLTAYLVIEQAVRWMNWSNLRILLALVLTSFAFYFLMNSLRNSRLEDGSEEPD